MCSTNRLVLSADIANVVALNHQALPMAFNQALQEAPSADDVKRKPWICQLSLGLTYCMGLEFMEVLKEATRMMQDIAPLTVLYDVFVFGNAAREVLQTYQDIEDLLRKSRAEAKEIEQRLLDPNVVALNRIILEVEFARLSGKISTFEARRSQIAPTDVREGQTLDRLLKECWHLIPDETKKHHFLRDIAALVGISATHNNQDQVVRLLSARKDSLVVMTKQIGQLKSLSQPAEALLRIVSCSCPAWFPL